MYEGKKEWAKECGRDRLRSYVRVPATKSDEERSQRDGWDRRRKRERKGQTLLGWRRKDVGEKEEENEKEREKDEKGKG